MYASVSKSIIGSHNGLPPDRRQAIIGIIADLLIIKPLKTPFNHNWVPIEHLKCALQNFGHLCRPECANTLT